MRTEVENEFWNLEDELEKTLRIQTSVWKRISALKLLKQVKPRDKELGSLVHIEMETKSEVYDQMKEQYRLIMNKTKHAKENKKMPRTRLVRYRFRKKPIDDLKDQDLLKLAEEPDNHYKITEIPDVQTKPKTIKVKEKKIRAKKRIIYPPSPNEMLTPSIGVKFRMNAFQEEALRELLNLEIDLEDTAIINAIISPRYIFENDWEYMIFQNIRRTVNSLVPYRLPYPIDRSRKNDPELAKLIKRYIKSIMATRGTHGEPSGETSEFIRAMKQFVQKLPDTVKTVSVEDTIETKISNTECKSSTEPQKDIIVSKGYKNVISNVNYYHASTQTYKHVDYKLYVSRQAQTPNFPLIEKSIMTTKTQATQVARDDYFVDTREDRIMCPRPYIETNPLEDKLRLNMAKRIQKYFRKFMLINCKKALVAKLEILKDNETIQHRARTADPGIWQYKYMMTQDFLSKREDSNILYLTLQNWWQSMKNTPAHLCAVQTIRKAKKPNNTCLQGSVERNPCNDKAKALAANVLKKDVQEYLDRLLAIENLVVKSREKVDDLYELGLIEEAAKPKKIIKKDKPITIFTLESQRAEELKRMLYTMKRRDTTLKERISFLACVKSMLINEFKELDSSKRVLSLIQQELDYINAGISPDRLTMIREKMEQHFLKFIQSKKVNPNMNKLLDSKYPPDCGNKLHKCYHCGKVKHIRDFREEEHAFTTMSPCKTCFYSYVIGSSFQDNSKYTMMLYSLRETEIKLCTLSPVTMLMNEKSIYYLVFHIWQSQSIISGESDPFKLKLCRWIIHKDWTPWNNILITLQEYESHIGVKDVYTFYTPSFIRKVNLRNLRAKQTFYQLLHLDATMKETFWFEGEAM